MNIIIKSVNFKASDNLKAFIHEKLKKLFRYSDNIIRVNTVLRKGESKNPQNKLCEIRLIVPGYDHYVKKSSEEFQRSVSQSVEVLEEILRRNKTRLLINR
ncbi:MAG: ribosome-associated translation inhibitor RaiA [Parafilimonas sp.]